MKKTIAAVIAAAALCSMTGCLNDQKGSSSQTEPTVTENTAAADTSAAETTTAAASETASEEMTTEEESSPDYTDLAYYYYSSRTNHIPEFIDVQFEKDDTVTIHLYDLIDGHTSTCDWYYVDSKTCKGTNTLGEEIDLNSPLGELWNPDVPQRKDMSDSGCFCGIAYIGGAAPEFMEYSQTNAAIREQFLQSGVLEEFDFVSEIPESNFAQTELGTELYLIIPKDPEAHVTVTRFDLEKNCDVGRIYSSFNGAPFLLKCNYSDISSDIRISIVDNSGYHTTFSPYISAKDGTPQTGCDEVMVFEPDGQPKG